MSVTAKLSRRLYEQLGDETATELVEWFNAVDATYRSDVDRVSELNLARVDTKLERRIAEEDSKWEQYFAKQDTRWEQRLSHMELRLHKEIASVRVEIVRWMFGFWTGTLLVILGFMFAILKTRSAP